MKGVTDAKGLRNLKTATTRRIRAKPPQGGTAHLDMYLLGKEKQRLEQELAHLDERRGRIHDHLAGITRTLVELQQVVQQAAQAEDESLETSADPVNGNRRAPTSEYWRQSWNTMPLEY